MPGGVGAVDDGGDAAGRELGEQPGRGDDAGGGRADVVEDRDFGARGDAGQYRLAHRVLVGQARIQRHGGDGGPAGGGRDDGAVAVVGDQDLVPLGQRDGVQGQVGALGGVGDEGDAVRVGAEVRGDAGAGGRDPVRDADEEGVGVLVGLGPQRRLGLLDGDGDRAEGPVVQVGDAGGRGGTGPARRGTGWGLTGTGAPSACAGLRCGPPRSLSPRRAPSRNRTRDRTRDRIRDRTRDRIRTSPARAGAADYSRPLVAA
ncbi:hypothetical protein GCM10020254_69570 [Streptomyces goshikiensis]